MKTLSSVVAASAAIKETISLMPKVLSNGWQPLAVLFLIQASAGQLVGFATEHLHQSGREDLTLIALIALFQLVFMLLWSAAWIIAIVSLSERAKGRNDHLEYLSAYTRNFNQLIVEQIRSIASVLWRTPLLIVPALIQYVRLALVPFVVLFDPSYRTGHIDALKRSGSLSRGHFWMLSLILCATVGIPLMVESLAQSGNGEWIWVNPIGVGIGWFLTLFINIFCSVFLFTVFRVIFAAAENPAEASP